MSIHNGPDGLIRLVPRSRREDVIITVHVKQSTLEQYEVPFLYRTSSIASCRFRSSTELRAVEGLSPCFISYIMF